MSEIEKMDFKQLRGAVQELYDQYVKLKRTLDDALNNIDESNLATTFRKQLGNYASMLNITAESIESRVSYNDLENRLSQYSTIKQTADKIQMSVVQNQEYTDSATEELSSTFTMTADTISTNVTKLNKKVDGNYTKLYSSVTQTAEAIETIVGKEMTEYFDASAIPTAENTTDAQKEILCKYNNQLYYFNKITQTWREYNDSVQSAFKQTADGFALNGCVSVSGDLITSGTIKGIDIEGSRIWGDDKYKHRYFRVVSDTGDMGLFDKNAPSNCTVGNSHCLWGIAGNDAGDASLFDMWSCGQKILGYNSSQNKVYPKSVWDFSSCDEVRGLQTESGEAVVVKQY